MIDPAESNFTELISKALNIEVFSYNSEVTMDVWNVIKLLGEKKDGYYNTEISLELKLDPKHVELIQYLICNNGHAEYGTSPRGCWLTEKGFDLYNKLKELEPAMLAYWES